MTLFKKLKIVVEDNDTSTGRTFDLSIQVLIIFSLVSFSMETLPDLSLATQQVLSTSEAIVIGIFTVEYVTRVAVADKRFRFIFSFYGLIDLVAIVPFYLFPGIDLRAARAFRLLRLVRVLKLFRYSRAVRRFRAAFRSARDEMILFSIVTIILLYLSAVGIWYFEREAQPDQFKSVFHSLWWAVSTLTTVGYGDVYPVTVGGKIFTFVVLMVGLGIVAVPAGLFAAALTSARQNEVLEANEVNHK